MVRAKELLVRAAAMGWEIGCSAPEHGHKEGREASTPHSALTRKYLGTYPWTVSKGIPIVSFREI